MEEPVEGAAPVGFEGLGLSDSLLKTVIGLGYSEPTPIQREAIPPSIGGRDLLGQAATGTGKTAAFALPVLERIARDGGGDQPTALILVPTRELAIQVHKSTQGYSLGIGARILAVFGGQPIGKQLGPLKRGVDVVVATPGRALDHIRRGSMKVSRLKVLVLDEADEMLDMGFADELEEIMAAIPEERQTMLFSATMPPRIESMAKRHLNDPVRIRIKREKVEEGEAPRVRETAHLVNRPHKQAALGRVLELEQPKSAIVFCRTRHEVDSLTETLGRRGHRADALHGGMTQEQRDRAMGRLRAGSTSILVATDVAARGLDVDHLTHAFNYGLPTSPEQYVHRIGRVGRAGREGIAITIAEPREQRNIKAIQRLTKRQIEIRELPSVAELKAKRLEATRTTVYETIVKGSDTPAGIKAMAPYLELVRSLAQKEGGEDPNRFDPIEIAAAAAKLAHENSGLEIDEREIPPVGAKGKGGYSNGNGSRQNGSSRPGGYKGKNPRANKPAGDHTRLFFSVGKSASVAPRDLVGAIANEGGLSGRQIGTIEIKENFSLVEVPTGAADDVIKAMRSSRIKGRKATIRKERF
ncbi:MAG TPA: DEAD/DEAH box helicase [Solirubrobacterales bacterium]|nr:DEAD/DEAH box helicase [Solirubrobacterales bacterium]